MEDNSHLVYWLTHHFKDLKKSEVKNLWFSSQVDSPLHPVLDEFGVSSYLFREVDIIVAPLENVDLRVGGEIRVGVDLEGEEGDELGKEPLVHVLAHLVQHKPVADAAKKVGSDVDSIAASLFV